MLWLVAEKYPSDHLATSVIVSLLDVYFLEADGSLGGQKPPRILWNPKVRYSINKFPPPVSLLSQINQVHAHIPLFEGPF